MAYWLRLLRRKKIQETIKWNNSLPFLPQSQKVSHAMMHNSLQLFCNSLFYGVVWFFHIFSILQKKLAFLKNPELKEALWSIIIKELRVATAHYFRWVATEPTTSPSQWCSCSATTPRTCSKISKITPSWKWRFLIPQVWSFLLQTTYRR